MTYKLIYRLDNQCDCSYLINDASNFYQAIRSFAHFCVVEGFRPVSFGCFYYHINNRGKVSKRMLKASHISHFWNNYDSLRMAHIIDDMICREHEAV